MSSSKLQNRSDTSSQYLLCDPCPEVLRMRNVLLDLPLPGSTQVWRKYERLYRGSHLFVKAATDWTEALDAR